MEYKYTNEALRKKFKSQFELVSYAISLAENMIITGRDPRIKIDNQNRALQVLAEISAGKDIFDPVIPENKYEEKAGGVVHAPATEAPTHKTAPERKRRKILVE